MTHRAAIIAGTTFALISTLIASPALADAKTGALSLAHWDQPLVSEPTLPTAAERFPAVESNVPVIEPVGVLPANDEAQVATPEDAENDKHEEDDALASGATFAEGGRDLVPRFRYVSPSSLSPFIALEIYGDAGAKPSLLGYDDVYMRTNPVVTFGLSPSADITIYAGLGPGGALVSPSAEHTDAAESASRVAVTGAALVGLRFTGAELPMIVQARADTVGDDGTAGMLTFTMELVD